VLGAPAPTEWRPLLTGSAADAAVAIVDGVAAALRDAVLPDDGADIALFFAERHRLLGRQEDADEAVEHLERELADPWPQPWLYGGWVGTAAKSFLLAETLEIDAGAIYDAADGRIAELLRPPGWSSPFDLSSGLLGLGLYSAIRGAAPSAHDSLLRVLELLQELAYEREGGLAWLTLPEHLGDAAVATPRGNFVTGVCHGTAGAVGFLGEAAAGGAPRQVCERLADGAVQWLLGHRLAPERESGLPTYIDYESGPEAQMPRGNAWCMGDSGTAVALMGAARRFARRDWETAAIDLALAAVRHSEKLRAVRDAGICHGASGNGHIFNRLYQATGLPAFGDAARRYFTEALDLRGEGQRYGAHAFLSGGRREGVPCWAPDASLLTGSAGLGLALIAAVSSVEPKWDRLLLTHIGAASH
jgi:hypothetical protein